MVIISEEYKLWKRIFTTSQLPEFQKQSKKN